VKNRAQGASAAPKPTAEVKHPGFSLRYAYRRTLSLPHAEISDVPIARKDELTEEEEEGLADRVTERELDHREMIEKRGKGLVLRAWRSIGS